MATFAGVYPSRAFGLPSVLPPVSSLVVGSSRSRPSHSVDENAREDRGSSHVKMEPDGNNGFKMVQMDNCDGYQQQKTDRSLPHRCYQNDIRLMSTDTGAGLWPYPLNLDPLPHPHHHHPQQQQSSTFCPLQSVALAASQSRNTFRDYTRSDAAAAAAPSNGFPFTGESNCVAATDGDQTTTEHSMDNARAIHHHRYRGHRGGRQRERTPPFHTEEERLHWQKERRKKDIHNKIEQRRRYNINDRIHDLGILLLNSGREIRQNKGTILRETIDYIKMLRGDQLRLNSTELAAGKLEQVNGMMLQKIQQIHSFLESNGVPTTSFAPDQSNHQYAKNIFRYSSSSTDNT